MPIDPGDLIKPEQREVINLSATDLTVEAPGTLQIASRGVENFVISRRDFLKWLGYVSGGVMSVALGILAFMNRGEIINSAIENWDKTASKFTVVEEKPVDQRIIETFGEDYSAWAIGQAQGQYGLYLMGNEDKGFNITNIPTSRDKDNIVWLLTYQYGPIWPFVTPETDGDVLDPDLYPYPLASKESFVNRIADDLDLNDQQRIDLLRRWKFLSTDPQAVTAWLEDLKSQGVKSVTDDMIKFYSDPISFVTETNQ